MLKRLCALAVCLMLCASSALAETMQDCHRFTLTREDTTQQNKSVIRMWNIETSNDFVTAELMDIAAAYADRIGPTLEKAKNTTSQNSRLDVAIRASRTGLRWMSFLVQARTTYHRKLIGQEITSRTYDMIGGYRVMLSDIFAEGSEGWELLSDAVANAVLTSFPDEEPDAEALASLLSDEGLQNLDFTLHGYSMVLHIPAGLVYPGKQTLIEATLMYSQIRPYMTIEAQIETDNLTYYKTVALTFDDGPHRTNTTKVLNSLLECGERGTFFVIGNRVSGYADLVQRENDEGHAVASHNWNHNSVAKMSGSTMRAMVNKINAAMIEAIGIPARYNRVPYGLYPQMISAKVGWPLIQWSVDTYDWRGRSVSTIMGNIRGQFTDGDIVLMHDIKDNTPNLVATLIPWLQEQGYMFLTIDELFAKDGVTLQPDTVYYRCEDGVTTIKSRD